MTPFEKANIRKIFFFFPYHTIGGVPVLFLRMAHALVGGYPELHISLIDYPDGYMARNVTDSRLKILHLVPGKKIIIDDDSVCVMQSLPLWRLPEEISFGNGTRLLFWHLHPFNISPGSHWLSPQQDSFSLSLIIRKMLFAAQRQKLRKLVEECFRCQGIVFMDRANLEGVRLATGAHIDVATFVPVPGSDSIIDLGERLKPAVPLRCAWIGRLEDFKIPILSYTLKRIAAYATNRNCPVEFHIIGDGEEADQLVMFAKELKNQFFSVIFHGTVPLERLDMVLVEHVDLLFAMGTAALEGAKLAIPVVLLDFSYTQLTADYQYRYLFDSEEYTLGSMITDRHYCAGNSSLELILDDARGSEYEKLAMKTRSYYRQYHSLDSVLKLFASAVISTKLTFSIVRRLRLAELDLPMRVIYALKRVLTGFDYHIPSE
ncbi:MAG: hypothetical protein ACOYLR_04215 [Chlorobium sp.]